MILIGQYDIPFVRRVGMWTARCEGQIRAVLTALEIDRATQPCRYWLGDTISHVDIALACALRLLRDAHPQLYEAGSYPALAALAQNLEHREVFTRFSQPFKAPA